MYFPSLGYCLLVAELFSFIRGKLPASSRNLVLSLVIGLCSIYSIRTWNRNYDWRDTEVAFAAAERLYPDNMRVVYFRINQEVERAKSPQELEKILEETSRALAIYPEYVAMINRHADILYKLKRYEDALHYYDRCFEASRSQAPKPCYFNKATIYELLGKKPEAMREYFQGLSLYGKNKEANFNYAALLMSENQDYAEAIRLLEKAKKNGYSAIRCDLKIAEALIALKKFSQALDRLKDHASPAAPASAQLLWLSALAHEGLGDAKSTKFFLEKLLKNLDDQDPTNAAYRNKAISKLQML